MSLELEPIDSNLLLEDVLVSFFLFFCLISNSVSRIKMGIRLKKGIKKGWII